jgi:hypothetical protein
MSRRPILMRRARQLDRSYRVELDALRKKPGVDQDELESLQHERFVEVHTLYEEVESLVTQRLLRNAHRLAVPVPDRPQNEDDENEHRRRAWLFGGWYLTAAGISTVRRAIRLECKERREAALAWISPLIALIGALTGLLAVWRR